jgi:hypothetical protein
MAFERNPVRGGAPSPAGGEPARMPGEAHAGDNEGGEGGSERRRLGADAEYDRLARPGGNDEGAERPVPDGERKAEVPIVMDGIGGMVQLVVGRALQDAAGEAGEGRSTCGCGAGGRR